ncbi:hypothetical protein B488_12340 [Liberibacter crescens BT-1]|uniref:Uncharacterized protein n=1 Tax=Liberibacter crescens (strain BT-1) TaxID=1215343 RepID=L0EXX1_LIBCB|nr:hypothetical protein B488_12340 [Liberibacter crescens BT-1]
MLSLNSMPKEFSFQNLGDFFERFRFPVSAFLVCIDSNTKTFHDCLCVHMVSNYLSMD